VAEVPPVTVHADPFVSLESGDHLTREEFHCRYLARPDIKKAELVEGIVWVGGRVSARDHGEPNAAMAGWLGYYAAYTTGVRVALHATVILDDRNELQPDVLAWLPRLGEPRVNDDGYLEGAPQLVVEIATSSVSYDLHAKKEAYRRNGVREYVAWRVHDGAIDWFHLREGEYVRVEPDENGMVESANFAGLRLHVPAMLSGDMTAVLAALREPDAR
jgi:Uma2 family endonuclease